MKSALAQIWSDASLPVAALEHVVFTGNEPVLPSSFAIGTAAQASLAAAALAAAEVGFSRNGLRQQVAVDMRHAALECAAHFAIDGNSPELWDKLAGLYGCSDGWLRLHTNFAHHRDGVLRLLGLPIGLETERSAVTAALAHWRALDFEQAAVEAGLVVAALRSFDMWDRHPQRAAVAVQPLVAIERIGDAAPLAWPALPLDARPLAGLRVIELTRILAGPVGGRTLAAYGADVMLINAPHLPNIDAIADTSRGKLSALVDLREPAGRDAMRALVRDTHVFVEGYRPGGIEALGFGPATLAALRPGIVSVSLSAYGNEGPWAGRRGFDSLVQSATGFNVAEAEAAGADTPKALPVQLLDMATGFFIAFGAAAALLRQQREGGSWQVRVSLARTAQWLRDLGRVEGGFGAAPPEYLGLMETGTSGYGELTAMRHAAVFSRTPARWSRPSMPPGAHPLVWPLA
jgi:crotonobetainyl-CoA:carnitine CoA-transferase CaiB-like acyl-CoA transferase